MSNKAVISLTTGLEDAERVTVAFLVALGAAEKAGGSFLVRPICFDARKIDKGNLVTNAEMGGHSPHVGLDRRRGRDHLQLLTPSVPLYRWHQHGNRAPCSARRGQD